MNLEWYKENKFAIITLNNNTKTLIVRGFLEQFVKNFNQLIKVLFLLNYSSYIFTF